MRSVFARWLRALRSAEPPAADPVPPSQHDDRSLLVFGLVLGLLVVLLVAALVRA